MTKGYKTGGRKKIIGNCKVEGCARPLDSKGWCTYHYQRWYKHGTTDLINRGKSKHPNNQAWWDRQDVLPIEWKTNFWQFVKDVGDRPSEDHYLYKIDRNKPYAKDNFKWVKHIRRQPEETDKEWNARRWKQRKTLRPAMNEFGPNFRVFLKAGIVKSLEEFSELFHKKMKNQKELCAICNNSESAVHQKTKTVRRLALDHCHKTLKIRDLLCQNCNQALGLWEESVEFLKSTIAYLEKHFKNPIKREYTTLNKVDFLHENSVGPNHRCEICNKTETQISIRYNKKQRLSVDHCHKTMKIRGLICARCNTALGRMQDSIPNLQSMIAYIKRHSAKQATI